MLRKASCFTFVALCALLNSAPAWAAGDPSKVGDKLFHIVDPNIKSLWKIALIVGVLATIFGRMKPGLIVATYVALLLSGAVIWNSGGFGDMAQNIGNKLF